MLLRLALVCVVFLTSLSLGLARGQIRAGTEIILCGGTAVISHPDDPNKGARYCPDMATGLLLAFDPPPITAAPPTGHARRAGPPPQAISVPALQPVPQARAPPPPRAA